MPAVSCPPPPPAPEDATTWPEFTDRLRALYAWCGRPKYRALCGRCHGLSPAAVSGLIGRNPLTRPPETTTERFVEACLRYRGWPDVDDETARWIRRRKLIAGGAPLRAAAPGRLRRYAVAGSVVAAAAVTVFVVAAVTRRRRPVLNGSERRAAVPPRFRG